MGIATTITKFLPKISRGAAKTSAKESVKSYVKGMFGSFNFGRMGNGLGMFGKSLSGGISSSNVDSIPTPSMETPDAVSEISNPTLDTISRQMIDLVETASRIGMLVKEQQEILLASLSESRRNQKEDQLESGTNIPESGDQKSNIESLSPLSDSTATLIKQINSLIGILDNKKSEVNGDSPSSKNNDGILDKLKKIFLGDNAKKVYAGAAAGAAIYGVGKGVNELINPTPKEPIPTQNTKMSMEESKPIPTKKNKGNNSEKISQLISGKLRNQENKSDISENVRKNAAPLIDKALGGGANQITLSGSTDRQSAITHILKGNIIGAGIDPNGAGAALTAIPALVSTVSRDVYSSIYDTTPEMDPEFAERMSSIKSSVEDIVRNRLSQSLKGGTQQPQDIGTIETPSTPPSSQGVQPRDPSVNNISSPSISSTQSTSSSSQQVSSSGSSSAEQISPATASKIEQASSGEVLNAQSMPVDSSWADFGYSKDTGMFSPQTGGTNRSGAQGIGQIPDPVYRASNLDEINKNLYFNY